MLKIEPHPRHNVRCDIAGCKYPINPLLIYEHTAPAPLRLICCESHLKEIIEVGKAYLGIVDEPKQLDGDMTAQLEAKDAIIEKLQATIGTPPEGSHPDEANPRAETWHGERQNWAAEVKRLQDHIAGLDKKIEVLEVKLKAAQVKPEPKGRTLQTMKGKGKKS
jgi:hypothetical protein